MSAFDQHIPTLADALAGNLPRVPRQQPPRVHILEDERTTKSEAGSRTPATAPIPAIQPFNPTGEDPMPRRKPTPEAAPADAEKPAKKRRGPKPGTKRTRKDGQPVGAASFVIDDRGGMEIRDGQQAVRLERPDVARLTLFLDRTKGIRA